MENKYYKVYHHTHLDNAVIETRLWCGLNGVEYEVKQGCGDWKKLWSLDYIDMHKVVMNTTTGAYTKNTLYIYHDMFDYFELQFDDFCDILEVFKHCENEIGERK